MSHEIFASESKNALKGLGEREKGVCSQFPSGKNGISRETRVPTLI